MANETLAFVFDTETTGVTKANWIPQMWEIGGVIINQKFEIKDEFNFIVKPRKELTQSEKDVITKVSKMDLDVIDAAPDLSHFMNQLVPLLEQCNFLVAHNLAFDREILFNELLIRDTHWRIAWPAFHYCSSEALEGILGRRLKLGDWYEDLFGKKLKGAHRANEDAMALVECLERDDRVGFELTQRKDRNRFWK